MTDTATARPAAAHTPSTADKPARRHRPLDAAKLAQEAAQEFQGQDVNPFALDDPLASAKYLMSRGWVPCGSPHFSWTRWVHKDWPTTDRYEKVVKTAPHIEKWNEQTKRYDEVIKPVMVKNRHNQPVPCEQTIYHPKREPITLDRALDQQLSVEQAAHAAELAQAQEQRQREEQRRQEEQQQREQETLRELAAKRAAVA